MICPECKKEGKKSQVYPGMSTVTAMYFQPYYDEEGRYHHHDGNHQSTSYSCSNGHDWMEDAPNSCPEPTCNWPKDED